MEVSFSGKHVAVTGGFSGIGLAVVEALAKLGADVYVFDFLPEIPQGLKTLPNIHSTPAGDVSDPAACKRFLDNIPGRLDGLVNCAGILPAEGKIASPEMYRRIVGVNLNGTWNMGTEALRRMNEQEPLTSKVEEGVFYPAEKQVGKGSIINISSGGGLAGRPGRATYCATKHAVIGLARAWSIDWPQIRVNVVAPGATDTPLLRAQFQEQSNPAEYLDAVISQIPMGRLGYASDVADMVVFLLSNAAGFITGQVFKVNGGYD